MKLEARNRKLSDKALQEKLETGNQKLEDKAASFQFLISSFCFLVSSFCFLLCLLLVSPMTLKAAAPDPDSAEALVDAGHWKRARAIVEPRVAANPRDAQAAYLLSRIKLAFGDLDGALKPAQQAVALEDGNSNYHYPTCGSLRGDGG